MEVEPQPDEKYNEEIKKGKIMCGRTSYGDEPCPDASKRACKKADPAPVDHPELRYYVKYLPKVEDAVVVPEGDEPAGADQESGMGNQITDNAAADMELDEINYHMMDGPWKGPNDISASPEPRPSEQALSERHDDVSSLQPKLCHCDKWLAGGSNELKYRCVKVEGTVKNPVNVCTENYGGKVNQCPSDSQAQACTGVPPPSPPSPPPAPPSLPSPPASPPSPPASPSPPTECEMAQEELMGKIGTLADALISGEEQKIRLMTQLRDGHRYGAMVLPSAAVQESGVIEIRHEHARGR